MWGHSLVSITQQITKRILKDSHNLQQFECIDHQLIKLGGEYLMPITNYREHAQRAGEISEQLCPICNWMIWFHNVERGGGKKAGLHPLQVVQRKVDGDLLEWWINLHYNSRVKLAKKNKMLLNWKQYVHQIRTELHQHSYINVGFG